MNDKQQALLKRVTIKLQETGITDWAMPSYWGVPLNVFAKDDLIRIAKRLIIERDK